MPTLITLTQFSNKSPSHNNQTKKKKKKKHKRNPNWKKKEKITTNNKKQNKENPDSTQKPLNLINEFSTEVEYKINIQKSVAFLNINNKVLEKEY